MKWYAWLKYFEPALLRTAWVQIVALLATFGVTVSGKIDTAVGQSIALLVIIIPLIQGLLTRQAVVSPATADGVTKQDVKDGVVPIPGQKYDPLPEDVGDHEALTAPDQYKYTDLEGGQD